MLKPEEEEAVLRSVEDMALGSFTIQPAPGWLIINDPRNNWTALSLADPQVQPREGDLVATDLKTGERIYWGKAPDA